MDKYLPTNNQQEPQLGNKQSLAQQLRKEINDKYNLLLKLEDNKQIEQTLRLIHFDTNEWLKQKKEIQPQFYEYGKFCQKYVNMRQGKNQPEQQDVGVYLSYVETESIEQVHYFLDDLCKIKQRHERNVELTKISNEIKQDKDFSSNKDLHKLLSYSGPRSLDQILQHHKNIDKIPVKQGSSKKSGVDVEKNYDEQRKLGKQKGGFIKVSQRFEDVFFQSINGQTNKLEYYVKQILNSSCGKEYDICDVDKFIFLKQVYAQIQDLYNTLDQIFKDAQSFFNIKNMYDYIYRKYNNDIIESIQQNDFTNFINKLKQINQQQIKDRKQHN